MPIPDVNPDDAPISRFPLPDPAALPDDIRQVIEQNATKAGFVSLFDDGILRALEGRTTVEEISRVIHAS